MKDLLKIIELFRKKYDVETHTLRLDFNKSDIDIDVYEKTIAKAKRYKISMDDLIFDSSEKLWEKFERWLENDK